MLPRPKQDWIGAYLIKILKTFYLVEPRDSVGSIKRAFESSRKQALETKFAKILFQHTKRLFESTSKFLKYQMRLPWFCIKLDLHLCGKMKLLYTGPFTFVHLFSYVILLWTLCKFQQSCQKLFSLIWIICVRYHSYRKSYLV